MRAFVASTHARGIERAVVCEAFADRPLPRWDGQGVDLRVGEVLVEAVRDGGDAH